MELLEDLGNICWWVVEEVGCFLFLDIILLGFVFLFFWGFIFEILIIEFEEVLLESFWKLKFCIGFICLLDCIVLVVLEFLFKLVEEFVLCVDWGVWDFYLYVLVFDFLFCMGGYVLCLRVVVFYCLCRFCWELLMSLGFKRLLFFVLVFFFDCIVCFVCFVGFVVCCLVFCFVIFGFWL